MPDYRGPQGAYSTGFKPITHQQVGQFNVVTQHQLLLKPAPKEQYVGSFG